MRVSVVFSLHGFFIFWPVLLLPLAMNLILFDSQYFGIHEVFTESCTTPLYERKLGLEVRIRRSNQPTYIL